VFTSVLWQFMTKFPPLTYVFRCATYKQGWYTRKRVDTPESWHTVCLIFGREVIAWNNIFQPFSLEGIINDYPFLYNTASYVFSFLDQSSFLHVNFLMVSQINSFISIYNSFWLKIFFFFMIFKNIHNQINILNLILSPVYQKEKIK